MELSNTTKVISGIILITVPTIEFGGTFLLGMLKSSGPGYVDNPLRQNLFRAGHAHAGVLVILSLVMQLFVDSLNLPAAIDLIATARRSLRRNSDAVGLLSVRHCSQSAEAKRAYIARIHWCAHPGDEHAPPRNLARKISLNILSG